ncbi:MAG: hypothetical protein J5501_06360 [Ruminococcus sp.]|nr:hypothetical protein [Ruminococcus sp.]
MSTSMKCPSCGADIHYGVSQHHAQCEYCHNWYNVPDGTPYVPVPEPEPAPEPVPEQKPETEPDEKDVIIFTSRMKTWRRDWLKLILVVSLIYSAGVVMRYLGFEEGGMFPLLVGIAMYVISPAKVAEARPFPAWMLLTPEIREARKKATMVFAFLVHAGIAAGLFFLIRAIFARIH